MFGYHGYVGLCLAMFGEQKGAVAKRTKAGPGGKSVARDRGMHIGEYNALAGVGATEVWGSKSGARGEQAQGWHAQGSPVRARAAYVIACRRLGASARPATCPSKRHQAYLYVRTQASE